MSEGMGAAPVIDEIDKRRLDLIRQTVAKDCTDAEIASFLELATRYDLDPFAHEIWCVKNKGKLLIMVGRDGLRKVAQRQGFIIDGDVVRENDTFEVRRDSEGRRVLHAYGHEKDRGVIVGAWCQVTALPRFGPMEHVPIHEAGFFYAPLSEYKPRNVNEYSPWAKQTSVMILAAAERQALRQATPLSGLLAEGEHESAQAQLTMGEGDGEPVGWQGISPDQVGRLEGVLRRAQESGHAGYDRASVEMIVNGQDREFIAEWVDTARDELARHQRTQETADVILDAAEAPKEAAGFISWKADREANSLTFHHPGCDGHGATWVVPLDDAPLPAEGRTEECANCAAVLPTVAPHQQERPTLEQHVAKLEARRGEILDEIAGHSHQEGREWDELHAELAEIERTLGPVQIPGQEKIDL